MSCDTIGALGAFLTSGEAEALAVQFGLGQHTAHALLAVNGARRPQVKELLVAAGLGHLDVERTRAVLCAVAGAKSLQRDVTPVWTMPGNEAKTGHLTGEFHRLVQAARQSIVCATYNFEPTSQMWTVLQQASEQPGVVVTVYVDGDKADSVKVKTQLPKATVYRSGDLPNGKHIVSHAKFIIIDHEVVLLTSANFSYSAEKRNVELGLLIEDSALAGSIETTMSGKHGTLYELT